MFHDISEFHRKFRLDKHKKPNLGTSEYQEFRLNFIKEEVAELEEALKNNDKALVFDALIDIVYVTLGTAYVMGFPWRHGWNEVHDTNMKKVRVDSGKQSKRGSTYDVIKPRDWQPPRLEELLRHINELRRKDESPKK
tara:strand:+ start:139 stop:552 length:414 start_codon:yes stop_codon:yes gene_type:complete